MNSFMYWTLSNPQLIETLSHGTRTGPGITGQNNEKTSETASSLTTNESRSRRYGFCLLHVPQRRVVQAHLMHEGT